MQHIQQWSKYFLSYGYYLQLKIMHENFYKVHLVVLCAIFFKLYQISLFNNAPDIIHCNISKTDQNMMTNKYNKVKLLVLEIFFSKLYQFSLFRNVKAQTMLHIQKLSKYQDNIQS